MFNILRDERGSFLGIYLLGMYCLILIFIVSFLLATVQGIRKNAVAAYSWFEEAGDFATYTAAIDGVSTASDDTTPQVRGYFDTLFSGITQTTANGNEYDPAAGSPFKGPIELTGFTPYNQGATLPNGSQANADGYWISATVPVFVGTVPYVGQQTVNVPMSYYAEL